MNETTKRPETIRCPYCGQVETLAQARACGRLDAETPSETEPEPRWLGESDRFSTW